MICRENVTFCQYISVESVDLVGADEKSRDVQAFAFQSRCKFRLYAACRSAAAACTGCHNKEFHRARPARNGDAIGRLACCCAGIAERMELERVDVKVYEHNRAAYEAAVDMMEQTGKAAIVHPTGTGKSFIGFRLCADHPGLKILWLSPSEYIFKTQLENLKAATGGDLP
ncbi:MAG: hypothetical protein LIP11_03725, partial [Clostridiales bacterium]|nr:hypothetical protein [Clostridiales bacterium]